MLAVAGALAWRLTLAPIYINFLNQQIESALDDLGLDLKFKISQTSILWRNVDSVPEVRIYGISAVDNGGRTLGVIEETSIGVSFSGLMSGTLAPRTLDILGPSLRMLRDKGGAFQLELGNKALSPADASSAFQRLITALEVKKKQNGPLSYLRRLSLVNADLIVDDFNSTRLMEARDTDVILLIGDDSPQATFSSEILIDKNKTDLEGRILIDRPSNEISMTATISGFPLKQALRLRGLERHVDKSTLNVNGSVTAKLSIDGTPLSARFTLRSGRGEIINSKIWPNPISLKSVYIDGNTNFENNDVSIEKFKIDLGPSVLSGTAETNIIDGSSSSLIYANVTNFDKESALRLWPAGHLNDTRDWISEKVVEGRIPIASISFQAIWNSKTEHLEFSELEAEGRIEQASIRFGASNQTISQIHGNLKIGSDRILFGLERGTIKTLSVKQGSLVVNDLSEKQKIAELNLNLEGLISEQASIFSDVLSIDPRQIGFDVISTRGTAKTHFLVKMPLGVEIKPGQLDFQLNSITDKASLREFFDGKTLSDGRFRVQIDPNGIELDGSGVFASTPIKLRWSESWSADHPYSRRAEIQGVFSQSDWEQFRLAQHLSGRLEGPLGLDIALLKTEVNAPLEVFAKVQMQACKLSIAELGWLKKPGEVALGWMTAQRENNGRLRIKNFSMASQGLKLSAAADFSSEGKLRGAHVDRLVFGQTDMSLRLVSDPNGNQGSLSIVGRSFDLSNLWSSDFLSKSIETSDPIKININVDKIILSPELQFQKVRGVLSRNQQGRRSVDVSSVLSTGSKVSFDFRERQSTQYLRIMSENAGHFARDFGISNSLRGGALQILAKRPSAAQKEGWSGIAKISDFSLVKAPLLTRLLTLSSLTGILNTLGGQGIAFARSFVEFDWRKRKIIFKNARAVGSDLGITGEGSYNRKNRLIDFRGTIIPAYTINSALGNIPLLGNLLAGTKGEGMFAATYRVLGDYADPGVRVNPLSALAPGLLRNLVEILSNPIVDSEDPIVGEVPSSP